MKYTNIARPYAKAAFEFALEQNKVAYWHELLQAAAKVALKPEVHQLFFNPDIDGEQMESLWVDCLKLSDESSKRFFVEIIRNHRLVALPAIAEEFMHLKTEHEKSIEVEVTIAMPMTKEQEAALKQSLEKKFNKTVYIESTVDESILGGAIIRIDDLVIDGSVQGRLTQLREYLKGNQSCN